MRKLSIIMGMMFIAFASIAGEQYVWTVTTHATTSTVAVTKYADPFIGEIDEIAVYTPSGVTGAVTIAAIDPYSSTAFVLATNAAVTGYMVWAPRIVPPIVTGATSLTVTNGNDSTAEKYFALGESIRAVVSEATKTGQVFRIRLKIK